MLGKYEKQYYAMVLRGEAPADPHLAAAFAVVEDLTDRRGLRQEFEGIDDDLQEEIAETWARKIREALSIPEYDRLVAHITANPDGKRIPQDDMALALALELALSLLHKRRGKATREDVISEIADMENMIGQLKSDHGISDAEVRKVRLEKVLRSAARMGIDVGKEQ